MNVEQCLKNICADCRNAHKYYTGICTSPICCELINPSNILQLELDKLPKDYVDNLKNELSKYINSIVK